MDAGRAKEVENIEALRKPPNKKGDRQLRAIAVYQFGSCLLSLLTHIRLPTDEILGTYKSVGTSPSDGIRAVGQRRNGGLWLARFRALIDGAQWQDDTYSLFSELLTESPLVHISQRGFWTHSLPHSDTRARDY